MNNLIMSYSSSLMTKPNLERIQNTLTHALDSLDCHGASGVLAICLLPEGDYQVKAGGMCTDLTGAVMALYSATSAFRALAENKGETELVKIFDEAARLFAPAVTFKENKEVH